MANRHRRRRAGGTMFGRDKNYRRVSRITTVVGRDTKILGDVHIGSGLHVDGTVEGNVCAESSAESVLIVSDSGVIRGKVQVPHVILNGRVEGDIHAGKRIELATKARVEGDVYYHLLEMASGAEVNGKLVHESAHPRMLGFDGRAAEEQRPVADAKLEVPGGAPREP